MRTPRFLGVHNLLSSCGAVALLLSVACTGQDPTSPAASTPARMASTSPTTLSVSPNSTTDNRAEQIVFSGQVPPGTFSGTEDHDVDFWVWCEHRMAQNSYAGNCVGSMGIDDLTKAVSGEVHMDADMDQHIIVVSSKEGGIACTLSDNDPAGDETGADADVPHTKGLTNDVGVACTAPSSFSGVFHGAVVIATESPREP